MTSTGAGSADLHHVLGLCSDLSSVAMADGDLSQVVELVARGADVWAAVVDDLLSVLAVSGGADRTGARELVRVLETEGDAVRQLVSAAAQMRRALSLPASGESAISLVVAPIIVGEDAVAYLVSGGNDVDEVHEDSRILVTEHAAMVSAVVLGRRRVVAIAAGRARRELFDGLVLVGDRSEADVDGWARHLGIEPDHRQRVLVVALESPGGVPVPAAVSDLVEHLIATRCPDATVVNRETEVVAVVPGDDDTALGSRLTELARLCRRAVAQRFPDVRSTAGLSDAHLGAGQLGTSYAEARQAVGTGRALPGLSDVAVFADLGVHRLLAQVRDAAELPRFVRHVLGPLIESDLASGTDYCRTLTVYFRENGSPQRAALLLHTHPNTVAYRVRRADEIAALGLTTHSGRLAAQLALEIMDGLGGVECVTSS